MTRIAHISDLHFGTVAEEIAGRLCEHLHQFQPELLVVSGDLTQRARSKQFLQAKKYLQQLPQPQLVVPGNHDIPLFDIFRRFLFPLNRYRKYISDDLAPLYKNDAVAVLGINTARSLTWKEGRVSIAQIQDMQKRLYAIPDTIFKIVVTHHPFIPPPGDEGIRLLGRSVKALHVIDQCCVELLLAGHLHQGYSGDVRPYYPKTRRSVIVAQAGTAISNRKRGEPNAYNQIQVDKNEIALAVQEWDGRGFQPGLQTSYVKEEKEWLRRK